MLIGNSRVVQWLRLRTSNARAQVRPLVRELRSHKQAVQCGKKKTLIIWKRRQVNEPVTIINVMCAMI